MAVPQNKARLDKPGAVVGVFVFFVAVYVLHYIIIRKGGFC